MSKQDRQGVRTATDLERKYDFGLLSQVPKNDDEISKIIQEFTQYKVHTDNELANLKKLPIATKETLGCVIIGNGINVGKDGTIWVENSSGDMEKAIYDKDNDGVVDNALKVNGYTVEKNVPSNAKFTDTTYGLANDTADGLLPSSLFAKLNELPNASSISLTYATKISLDDLSKKTYSTGKISANESLDNYVTPGIYFCENGSIAGTLINSPTTDGFRLEVMGTISAGATTRIWQVIYTNASTEATIRCYKRQLSAIGWTDWKKDFYWSDIKVTSEKKTTNANGNIGLSLPASSNIIISASFERDSGTTANCTVYTNAGNMGIHVADNSGSLLGNVSGTLTYAYIKL